MKPFDPLNTFRKFRHAFVADSFTARVTCLVAAGSEARPVIIASDTDFSKPSEAASMHDITPFPTSGSYKHRNHICITCVDINLFGELVIECEVRPC